MRKPSLELETRKNLNKPKKKDPFKGLISQYHRISLNESLLEKIPTDISNKIKEEANKFCDYNKENKEKNDAKNIFELKLSYKEATAFIIECNNKLKLEFPKIGTFDINSYEFSSNKIASTINKDTPLLIEKLISKKNNRTLINKTSFEMKLKTKFLLSSSIQAKEIKSKITSVYEGPVSTQIELATAFKILGISKGLDVCCDVSFYDDAFYLPILVDMPISGSSLKSKSGIGYGIDIAKDMEKSLFSLLERTDKVGETMNANKKNTVFFNNDDEVVAIMLKDKNSNKNSDLKISFGPSGDLTKYDFDLLDFSHAFHVDLANDKLKGRQQFEIWFYIGKKREELETYFLNEGKYQLQQL